MQITNVEVIHFRTTHRGRSTVEGYVHVSQEPGLGVVYDWD